MPDQGDLSLDDLNQDQVTPAESASQPDTNPKGCLSSQRLSDPNLKLYASRFLSAWVS